MRDYFSYLHNLLGLFNGILLNNGRKPVLTADDERGTCNLTGAVLNNKNFQRHDLNSHFGCDTERDSEPTIDGSPSRSKTLIFNRDSFKFLNPYRSN